MRSVFFRSDADVQALAFQFEGTLKNQLVENLLGVEPFSMGGTAWLRDI